MADDREVVSAETPGGGRVRCTRRLALRLGYSVLEVTDRKLEARKAPLTDSETVSDGSDETPSGDDTKEVEGDAQKSPESQERPDAADVRKWAAENGIQVSPQGKIAKAVYEQYADAHKS